MVVAKSLRNYAKKLILETREMCNQRLLSNNNDVTTGLDYSKYGGFSQAYHTP